MGGKWAMSHLQCQREAFSRIKTEQPFPLDDSNATCHFLLTSWRSLALLQYDIEQHSTCTFFNSRLFWSALMMFVPCDSQWKFFILPSSTTSRNRSVHLHSSKGLFSAHVLLDSAWHSLRTIVVDAFHVCWFRVSRHKQTSFLYAFPARFNSLFEGISSLRFLRTKILQRPETYWRTGPLVAHLNRSSRSYYGTFPLMWPVLRFRIRISTKLLFW